MCTFAHNIYSSFCGEKQSKSKEAKLLKVQPLLILSKYLPGINKKMKNI